MKGHPTPCLYLQLLNSMALILLLLAMTCMLAHSDRTDLARKLLTANGTLRWDGPQQGLVGDIYKVEEPGSGRKALIELEPGSGELREFTLLGNPPTLKGPALSEEALVQEARTRAEELLPASYGIAGLVSSTSQPKHLGPVTSVILRGMQGDIPVPPRVAVQLSNDGKILTKVLISESPISGLRVGDVKLSAEKAAELAIGEAVRRVAALTTLSENRVQELAGYAPEGLPSLFYSNDTLGEVNGLPTPGAFYNVKVIRTKPTSTSESDRLLDHLYVTVDANTGQFGAPPGIAGSSTPSASSSSSGSQPIIAFALLALAALLLIFLVVKLRKR